MAETNGSGRLDRIESLLEKLAERQETDHENFTREAQQLLTWQVLMQEKMDRYSSDREADRLRAEAERKRLDALSEKTDERVASLVRAIGSLIEQRKQESQ